MDNEAKPYIRWHKDVWLCCWAKWARHGCGPITKTLLPIPTEAERNQHAFELYQTGERGGWTRHELPEAFWWELWDLLDRYGGIDGDGHSRLRVFHYHPVESTHRHSAHEVDGGLTRSHVKSRNSPVVCKLYHG